MTILLNTETKTRAHRQRKRHLEISMILDELENYLRAAGKMRPDCRILEFGCGNGFQIPYLERLGKVVATDIYRSREMAGKAGIPFCESSVQALPFAGDTFDIIFSSHVIEHIPQPDAAIAELARVGKDGCLFVFSVPTNIWLLLSLPAKYLGKLNRAAGLLKGSSSGTSDEEPGDLQERMEREGQSAAELKGSSWLKGLLPKGHGVYLRFGDCYRAFRIRAWTDFFRHKGFAIHATVPLLLYGPSERPIIPTSARLARYGICSSVLFIMARRQNSNLFDAGAHGA